MIKNYFKIAWRNLLKNKVFSFVNIMGLTIGITVCLMIFLYIMNEFSVDRFHVNAGNIYRVMRSFNAQDKINKVSYVSGPYGPALYNDFRSDIKQMVRVSPTNNLISFQNKSFNEKRIFDVDSNFFAFFSFPLLRGNPSSVLKDPSSVVLTETTAKKYFGSTDNAMGKVLDVDKTLHLKVTGIAKDVPSNSHLEFDLLIPIANYEHFDYFNVWINNSMYTYLMLNPRVDPAQLEKRMPQFLDKYMGADMKKYGFTFDLSLTPLKDVYFQETAFDSARHGDKKVVFIFLSIAVLILLIACINFTNLSTIRAVDRSREVGLRKVMGALRTHLVWQFIGESLLLTTVSCLLAIGILQLVMPWYNHLLGYQLTVSWHAMPIYLFLVGVMLVVGFMAGSYPAFFLSAFSPIQALKGKLKLGTGGAFFRQALVIVQFSISVFLVVGTIVVISQMKYIKNKQLGYNKEQCVVIPIDNGNIYNNRYSFKDQLRNENAVQSVSLMSGEPGGFFDQYMFDVEGHTEKWRSRTEFSDFQIVKTLGLKIIAGRDLSPDYPTDSTNAVLINETAAANLGWKPDAAVGKWIRNSGRDSLKRRIVGVVQDFNFLSLKQNMDALVITPSVDNRVAVVKTSPDHITSALAAIGKVYAGAAPGYPFEYTFLDEKFGEMYKNDIRQQTIITVFAALAIFIACLGLFGLASFAATKRTKEIGVRKVLGSSTENIVLLLSKDLLKPVLIASCLAIPLGYTAMDRWLQNFAYREKLNWWIFALAALISFAIAIITVSVRAINAALANPVKSLRSE